MVPLILKPFPGGVQLIAHSIMKLTFDHHVWKFNKVCFQVPYFRRNFPGKDNYPPLIKVFHGFYCSKSHQTE